MEKNKIIILGKNGFIAKNLTENLKKKKIKFIAYSKENLNLENRKSVSKLKKIIKPMDKIVFISSIAPVKNVEMLSRNIEILKNVIDALKSKTFDQLIYISSDAVYKDDARIINEFTPKTPISMHGNMHLLRENVLKDLFKEKLCILRPTLIYGANDPHNGYGPNKFLRTIKQKKNIELFGRCIQKKFIGSINIASGKVISFYDIAKACITKNRNLKIIFLPRTGPMPHNGYRRFDIRRLKSTFKIKIFTNLKKKIKN